jgi:hypothetical protein
MVESGAMLMHTICTFQCTNSGSVPSNPILLELSEFYLLCILPLCATILRVDEHCFLVVLWHLATILVNRSSTEVTELGLVDHASKPFGIFGMGFALLPTWGFNEPVVHCIDRNGHGVIKEYEVKCIPCHHS